MGVQAQGCGEMGRRGRRQGWASIQNKQEMMKVTGEKGYFYSLSILPTLNLSKVVETIIYTFYFAFLSLSPLNSLCLPSSNYST